MTNEEAISLLTQVNKILVNSNSWLENTHEPLNIAFDMAIKALSAESCEDAISRQAVLEIAKSSKSNWIDNSVLFKRVNDLPPVIPQQKTDVFDKIRAEIEQMNNIDYVKPVTVDEVLQIIDKYKTKSEE